MPMCHGTGGLAGQYQFGARTNGSILFLGGIKMALAVLFGSSLMTLCVAFPASVLGVLLAFAGMELALVCSDQTSRTDAFAMLLTPVHVWDSTISRWAFCWDWRWHGACDSACFRLKNRQQTPEHDRTVMQDCSGCDSQVTLTDTHCLRDNSRDLSDHVAAFSSHSADAAKAESELHICSAGSLL